MESNLCGIVLGSRDNVLSRWRHIDGKHLRGVPGQLLLQLMIVHRPHTNSAVVGGGDQELTVRRHRNGVNWAGMSGDVCDDTAIDWGPYLPRKTSPCI